MQSLCYASRPGVVSHLKLPNAAHGGRRPAVPCSASATSDAAAVGVSVEDKWIAKNIVPLVQASSSDPAVAELRKNCQSALSSMRMPSTRNEEYRFTDVSPVLNGSLVSVPVNSSVDQHLLDQLKFPEAAGSSIVLVDGVFRPELSDISALPNGTYVGGSAGAPSNIIQQLGAQSNVRGGPFAVINGSLAQDVLVIAFPANSSMQQPLYLLHISSSASPADTSSANGGGSKLSVSAPRLLINLAAGANVEVVEEYISATADGGHVSLPVAEVVLEKGAGLKHGYVNREAQGASHFKATLVTQAEGSSYELVEARVGGSLTRHDLGINQEGPDTVTTLKHFLLAGAGQLQDLHSKLRLDHPRGQADQLHKCIASAATGRGVFDGNVKVNRYAQKTDAGQLSRNLLLVPKATVNVKPNLQIIADDVKCTHGCAVSDLSQEELFYFRARGVSYEQARQALVFSFGAEVVQDLKYEKLVGRIQQDVVDGLKKAVQDM